MSHRRKQKPLETSPLLCKGYNLSSLACTVQRVAITAEFLERERRTRLQSSRSKVTEEKSKIAVPSHVIPPKDTTKKEEIASCFLNTLFSSIRGFPSVALPRPSASFQLDFKQLKKLVVN